MTVAQKKKKPRGDEFRLVCNEPKSGVMKGKTMRLVSCTRRLLDVFQRFGDLVRGSGWCSDFGCG